MSNAPSQEQAAGRPKGCGGGVSVRGADGQFRKRSWKDISPERSSGSNDTTQPDVSHQRAPSNATLPGQEPLQSQVDWAEDGGDWSSQSDSFQREPSVLDVYTHQLLSILEECVPPVLPLGPDDVDEVLESTFCFPTFVETKGVLNYDSFVMPGVCEVPLVGGGIAVAHWCNCCPELELQRCIFSGIPQGKQEMSYLESQAPQCIHLKALFKLGDAVELTASKLCARSSESSRAQSSGEQVAEERVLLLPFRGTAPKAALVGTTRSDCVVVVEKSPGRWNCTECYGKGKIKCWHVQRVMGPGASFEYSRMTPEQFEEQLAQDFDKTTGKRRLKCLSRAAVREAHRADQDLASLLMRRGTGQVGFPAVCQVGAPSEGECGSCKRPWADSFVSLVSGTIFHLLAPVQTQVQVRTCPCGRTVWHYGGRADGILNFNDKYLYSYEILQWYANQMWRAKVPFVSMWESVLSMYLAAGVDKEALKLYINQRQAFQDAFFDYITLLDINYSTSFRCTCAPPEGVSPADHEPSELIGDGVTLGYRADLSYLVTPWKRDNTAELKTGSLHQNRTFVQNAQIRGALLRFAQPPGKAGAGLIEDELEQLRTSLSNTSAKHLVYLLDSPQLHQARFFCSERAIEFLRAASVPQAAAILLPQEVESIIELLISSEHLRLADLGVARKLAERAPVLGRFLQGRLAQAGNQLGEADCLLLRDLLVVARKSYVEEPIEAFKKLRRRKMDDAQSERDSPGALDMDAMSEDEQFLRTGHYFPNQPISRQLPPYAADSFSQKVGPTCTKYKSQHKKLTPGIFPFFCIFCAMCVGFVVLPSAESPKIVFQTLFTRFRKLKRFICDNVCHLFSYALNREPKWAGDIHSLIDRLHTVNHKDCSPAFGIDRYASLRSVNSQRSEQKNSRLVNAKTQAAYMKQSNFLIFMRYYLHCLNRQEELGDLLGVDK